MLYKLNDIMTDIKVAMDENRESELLESWGDLVTLTNNEIIRSKVLDAVRMVETTCPVTDLDKGVKLTAASTVEGTTGRIDIPDDFMRLLYFRASDWKRAVFSVIDAESPLYDIQMSDFIGVKGNPERPVVAISKSLGDTSTGNRLEFFSTFDQTGAYECRYLPLPSIVVDNEGDECVDISTRCYRPVILKSAELVSSLLGRNIQQEQPQE